MPVFSYQSDTRTFSQVIEALGHSDDPKLHLDELVSAFGERGFGALMLFLGLVNSLPLPPGSTTVLGAPLLLLSLQLAFRTDRVWLPRWALKGSLDRTAYRKATARVIKPIRVIEKLTRPRLGFMTSELSEILIGVVCSVLALILILPIWGGNMAPALTIAVFGFGLMQRDGVVILLGWAGSALCAAILWLAWEILVRILMVSWTWAIGLA